LLIWKGQFQNDASDVGMEGTVSFSGRSAGVVPGFQPHVESLVVQAATHDENFFRIVMVLPTERGCVRTRKESGQPGIFTGLFIDAQRHFLGDAFQASDRLPTASAFYG